MTKRAREIEKLATKCNRERESERDEEIDSVMVYVPWKFTRKLRIQTMSLIYFICEIFRTIAGQFVGERQTTESKHATAL